MVEKETKTDQQEIAGSAKTPSEQEPDQTDNADATPESESAEIVSLDRFRKDPAPKS